MNDLYFCERLRGADQFFGFAGEIWMFQNKKSDPFWIITALHTDTRHNCLAGGTHCGVVGAGEQDDWPTLDAAIAHIADKADDMRRKLAVSGLMDAHDADGMKAAIVCTRPLSDTERVAAFQFLGFIAKMIGDFVDPKNPHHVLIGGDMKTRAKDLSVASKIAPDNIVGQLPEDGGIGETGPPTALGVMETIDLAMKIYGEGKAWPKTMAVQGLGSVGEPLVREALAHGWEVTVADPKISQLKNLSFSLLAVQAVDPLEIHKQAVTVFAPCAANPIITPQTINTFCCKMIISAQNTDIDLVRAEELMLALHQRGIKPVVPGYACNFMGIAMLLWQSDLKQLPYHMILERELKRHYTRVRQMLLRAKDRDVPPYMVAQETIKEAILH